MRLPLALSSVLVLAYAALLAGPLVACGDSDEPVTSANGDGGTSTPKPASNVAIEYKGSSTTVDVNRIATQDYKGESVVPLDKIWSASNVEGDLSKLEFDFEGDDTFRPTSKDRCKSKVPGTQLSQGYVLPEVRSLVWDEALAFPGCYSVKGVAKILAYDK